MGISVTGKRKRKGQESSRTQKIFDAKLVTVWTNSTQLDGDFVLLALLMFEFWNEKKCICRTLEQDNNVASFF